MKVEHKGGGKERITVQNLAGTEAVLGNIVVITGNEKSRLVKVTTTSGTDTFLTNSF